jgi:hypothetical protein
MAFVIENRVKETTTTTGTGTVTLLGASTGFQSFAAIGNANTTYYTIAAQSGNEWEVGIGTFTSSGTTLARTTVLSNSSGTEPSALSFSAGTKDVFVTYPSERAIYGDVTGSITPVDNALVRFDSTAGNIIQTSLVTVADDGAITAPQAGSIIPFYFANQAAFPSASTYHGAIAHSHADGAMYFAHGGVWTRMLNDSGPLGTPSSGTVTNLTGTASININGTVGATTATTGAFTTLSTTGNVGIGTASPGAKLAVVGTGYSPTITISDGATLNWDTSLGQVAQATLGGNRTFAAPTNLVNGGFYSLLIIQDGTGSRTISWNAVFDFTGGTAPTLSTAAGSKDLIAWRSDGTNLLEVGRSLGVA